MAWSIPSTRATNYQVSATNWNELVNDFAFLAELGYAEYTSTVAVTATTVATAQQIVTLGAVTYTNNPVMIEFFCPRVSPGAAQHNVDLRDGSTVIGTLATFVASGSGAPFYVCRRLTPSAGSHSYNVAAWNSSASTTNVNAGTGGAAGDGTTLLPGFIRATNIPT